MLRSRSIILLSYSINVSNLSMNGKRVANFYQFTSCFDSCRVFIESSCSWYHIFAMLKAISVSNDNKNVSHNPMYEHIRGKRKTLRVSFPSSFLCFSRGIFLRASSAEQTFLIFKVISIIQTISLWWELFRRWKIVNIKLQWEYRHVVGRLCLRAWIETHLKPFSLGLTVHINSTRNIACFFFKYINP